MIMSDTTAATATDLPTTLADVGGASAGTGTEDATTTKISNNGASPLTSTFQPSQTVTQKVLLSLREAARIIGPGGNTINNIRTTNGVKIGISPKEKSCSDRILEVSGGITAVANSLAGLVKVLTADDSTEEESGEQEHEQHVFKHLNFILPPPSLDEIEDPEKLKQIGNLRLIVTNSQVSSIIGTQGAKIKKLIEVHSVKLVVSKTFLPDSQDRILEIQGFPTSIANCIKDINQTLINDEVLQTREKRYYPHSKHSKDIHVTATVGIPTEYVGALLGHGGNRIANLRKYTRTKITVAQEPNQNNEREFTITGSDQKSVKLAQTMIFKNLETEKERRLEKQ
ncbi:HBL178Cp [Eremothecium sinecaudum]|uniref:HBL178Cp n=1 Tax=Eremothecium sinecaudum TaxID=45286 RepID=A0A120K0V2_9SACH|nr:HBL178Cp [Eremothecium sinecaudum]AMD18724.1 HBL178Cp [Eremothecium sinecaudum]